MISIPECRIRNCAHFQGVSQPDGTERTERVICVAFPAGIPDEIAYGANKHSVVYPGQTGIFVYTRRRGQ
jgi:hypothetical protein